MIKVMLIDDEYYFIEALKASIPWQMMGFEICCEAENGYDALEKVQEFMPDIALVDINMPFIDGLQFTSELREKGLDTKIIIITGYDEFGYARHAIQLGVEDYLLKPVNEKELVGILMKIKEDINKEAGIKLGMEVLKKQVEESRGMFRDKIINNLLQGSSVISAEEISKYSECLSNITECKSYQVLVIEIDMKEDLKWSVNDRQIWMFAVSNIAKEVLGERFNYELYNDINGRICLIIGYQECDGQCSSDGLVGICNRIRVYVSKHLDFTASIGVGNICNSLHAIEVSYKECLTALKSKVVSGGNRVVSYSMVNESLLSVSLFPVELKRQFLISMRVSDLSEIERIISSVFSEVRLKKPSIDMIISMCVELMSTCIEFVAETSNSIKSLFGEDLNFIDKIIRMTSIDEMEVWIKNLTFKVIEMYGNSKNNKSVKIIEDVKKYINENYKEFDLNIGDLTKQVYINYGYLCNVFKRHTGSTVNDYITEVRMKKAKGLIGSGNRSVSGVAGMVGYADSNYFSKCFKKYYGISPSEYIENISKCV